MPATVELHAHLLKAPSPRLFLALWGGMAVVDLARAAQAPPALQVALLALLAGGCSWGQRVSTGLAVAAIVWLVILGFVVNIGGELVITGWGDAVRLLLVVTAALTGIAVAR